MKEALYLIIVLMAIQTCAAVHFTNEGGESLPQNCGTRKYKCNLPANLVQNANTLFKSREDDNVIARGQDAVKGCLPWQVQLFTNGSAFCGGSIIDKRWIMTAAHCSEVVGLNGFTITAGILNLDKPEGSQSIGVEKIFVHPGWIKFFPVNDVALLKLSKDITFNNFVQPVCVPSLADEKKDYAPGNVIIAGWGATAGRPHEILQVAKVELISDADCKKIYPPEGWKFTIICAGGMGNPKRNICPGDSGSPLVRKIDGKFFALGVTSGYQPPCSNVPAPPFFTKVALEAKWIKDTIANN